MLCGIFLKRKKNADAVKVQTATAPLVQQQADAVTLQQSQSVIQQQQTQASTDQYNTVSMAIADEATLEDWWSKAGALVVHGVIDQQGTAALKASMPTNLIYGVDPSGTAPAVAVAGQNVVTPSQFVDYAQAKVIVEENNWFKEHGTW